MHIDHRGGHVNPIAAKEMVVVAQPRDDDYILLHDMESDKFPPRRFKISDELPQRKVEDWLSFTEEKSEEMKRKGLSTDYGNGLNGLVLRLSNVYKYSYKTQMVILWLKVN